MSGRPRSLSVAPVIHSHEPDLVPEHKEAIIAALRWAWAELARTEPDVLRDADEERVTSALQDLLNDYRNGERRTSYLSDFAPVSRGASQASADGRIGKKPDLTFHPLPYRSVTNTTRWGWFVECKIVDGAASVAAYRDKGVKRFSTGEYAAWMPSGAMLAYVRDRSMPMAVLDSSLQGRVGTKRHAPGPSADRSESEHDRAGLANPCVDVTLIHLWLQCPERCR